MIIPEWLGGAAAVGILAGFWQYIKSFLLKIVSLVFVEVKLENDVGIAVASYCYGYLKKFSFGNRVFNGIYEHIKPLRRTQLIAFENYNKKLSIFKRGFVPFLLGSTSQSSGKSDSSTPAERPIMRITYIKGTLNVVEVPHPQGAGIPISQS